MLRIQFRYHEDREKFLAQGVKDKLANLDPENYMKKVYITPDRSKAEREAFYKVKQECDRLNSALSEEDAQNYFWKPKMGKPFRDKKSTQTPPGGGTGGLSA